MPENTIISGVVNIDKPPGLTSHDIVARVRRLLTTNYKLKTKVGHTGTLDPFATGVLLVVVGPATRLIQFSHAWDKEYVATFTLGATSDTDDVTGQITENPPPADGKPTQKTIEAALKKFVGEIAQHPPAYSAVKVKGKKLYEYARAGNLAEVGERPPRIVTVHDIELLDYTYPNLVLRIRCGTGTYIRSIARDLGEQLGTGAYVSSLRRTRIGSFDSKDSVSLDKLSTAFPQALTAPSTLVNHLPSVTLTSHNVEVLRRGQTVALDNIIPPKPHASIAIFDEATTLVGIASFDPKTALLSPTINL